MNSTECSRNPVANKVWILCSHIDGRGLPPIEMPHICTMRERIDLFSLITSWKWQIFSTRTELRSSLAAILSAELIKKLGGLMISFYPDSLLTGMSKWESKWRVDPKSIKICKYQNGHQKLEITIQSLEINENTHKTKTQSQRDNGLRPVLVLTKLAVMGILCSCPRVMTMRCWKPSIPLHLSTRLRVVFDWVVPAKRKETRLIKFREK